MTLNALPQPVQPDDCMLKLASLRSGENYELADSTVVESDGWVRLERAQKPSGDVLRGQLGKPGLWKVRTDASRLLQRCAFEIPATLLAQAHQLRSNGDGKDPLREVIDWAEATASGNLACEWSPPPLEEVESWFRKEQLTFQSGPFVRQGNLIHCADRLAVTFPILSGLPGDLPEHRASWLNEQLIDAQNRIKMLRIGTTEAGTVQTELDLTGAPEFLLESLLKVGLDALRWCVQWLVSSVELLVDNRTTCRAMELCTPRV